MLLYSTHLIVAFALGSSSIGDAFSIRGRSSWIANKKSTLSLGQSRIALLDATTSLLSAHKGREEARNRSPLLTLEEEGPIQMGFWVPNRLWATANVVVPLRKSIAEKRALGTLTPMTPVMKDFKDFVVSNSVYRMWVNSMIDQANKFIENADPETIPEICKDGDVIFIESFDALFEIMNEIVTTTPSFNTSAMVGTPMNALFAICMGTDEGAALFHDAGFNRELKKVLDSWNAFLKSNDSLDKLDIHDPEKPGSWISKAAEEAGVWCDMQRQPNLPAYGYGSWNSFFTRRFVLGARPFLGTSDDICVGCETTPWQYSPSVSLESDFWIKDMPYSLIDIFGGRRELAAIFTGGQIYQGFLSATRYHRWQCPVDGELLTSWVEPGTYFAQRPKQGDNDPGTWEGTESQPYLGHVATRAIFIFNHPKCGMFAMICIGMVEVSTCYIRPDFRLPLITKWTTPKQVTKGEEIGMFEFGGSTHMLVFMKDKVELADFATNAVNNRMLHEPIKMGTVIATPSNNPQLNPDESVNIRIIAALVCSVGNDEWLETVTLVNTGSSQIAIDEWTIVGSNGKEFMVGSNDVSYLKEGGVGTISVPKGTAQFNNGIDGVIEVKDGYGNMVHSVLYNSEHTKKSGNTVLF